MQHAQRQGRILLSHGDGGLLTHQLVEELFYKHFGAPRPEFKGDAALLAAPQGGLALTTDSFVVAPRFFPGGDLGKLAVCGTVNDLVVSGARPLYLTAGFILEEGLELAELERLAASMAREAKNSGVALVAGDTKVVARGQADGVFINTTGLGVLEDAGRLSPANVMPGDAVLVSGPVGDHGAAVLAAREGIRLAAELRSDCASLVPLAGELAPFRQWIRAMRDPTRGGLATTLNELAQEGGFTVELREESIPVRPEVRGICSFLGLDPLYLACEGRMVLLVAREGAQEVAGALGWHHQGSGVREIGLVREGEPQLLLKTALGGTRRLGMLAGDPLPRIC